MADTYIDPETIDHPEDADGGGKESIEAWAEKRAMLPQMVEGPAGPRLNPEYWKFASARALMGWSAGQLVTEKEFDGAMSKQQKLVIR